MELAFSKKLIEERKEWLSSFVPGTYLDQSAEEISYSDFVNKVLHGAAHFLGRWSTRDDNIYNETQELILFSRADLERSIPSMVDGLKPGQRKILFCCFKKNLKNDIKVRQQI